MALGLSSAQVKNLLKSMGKNEAPTKYEKLWFKLHTGDPGAAGASNVAGETTRKGSKMKEEAPIKNEEALEWAAVSTAETYSHLSAWSAESAGTFLWSGALTASKAVSVGDTFTIKVSEISLNMTTAA